MKFCPNCGSWCEKNDRFCNNCGRAFLDTDIQQSDAQKNIRTEYQPPISPHTSDAVPKKRKKTGIIITIILVTAIVLAVGTVLILDATETIDFIDIIKSEDSDNEKSKKKDIILSESEKNTDEESSIKETEVVTEGEFSSKEPESEIKEMSDYEYILDKGYFIVGYTDFPPYSYMDETGNLVGFDTELAEAVAEELGLNVRFELIEWSNKITDLNAKSIDCIWNALSVTEEYKQSMDLSYSYSESKQILVVKKENAEKYTDMDALSDGTIVAVVRSSFGDVIVDNDEYFAAVDKEIFDNTSDALLSVKLGTADFAVVDYHVAIDMINANDDLLILEEIYREEYAVGFRKDSDFCDKVNECLEKLAENGTLRDIAEKYNLKNTILIK